MAKFILNEIEFTAKSLLDEVLIDPLLPDDFYDCPNEERDDEQNKMWWGRAYIETDDFTAFDDNYSEYKKRMIFVDAAGESLEPEDVFNKRIKNTKDVWFNKFPTGIRYTVHCLDGGDLDKPTCWDSCGSVDEAVACCKKWAHGVNLSVK